MGLTKVITFDGENLLRIYDICMHEINALPASLTQR